MPVSQEDVRLVRRFNRFYTRRIGLLREGLLDTPFSLTQARVLYEIARQPGTRSATLVADLGLDPGYLSRLLASFERGKLVTRTKSQNDARVNHLTLTAKGRAEFARLDARSRTEVADMLSALTQPQRQRLAASMTAIQTILDPPAAPKTVMLRSHLPGDIGWVVARHGELYWQEYHWDSTFEGLVAGIAGKFLTSFDPQCEHCWIAEVDGERVGCVFLVRATRTVAKLRMLLVEPSARGHQIGARLVDECIAFARQAGYHKLSLWTNSVLHAARRIYERAGFRLVKEGRQRNFGHDLVEQVWDLKL